MRKSNLTMILLVFAGHYSKVNAEESISYSYLELGYGQLNLDNQVSAKGIYLDGSMGVSDHFYLGVHYENRAGRGLDFDRYDMTLGFHTNGSGSTDFYIDARVGSFEFDNIDGQSTGIFAGTRSTLGSRFELLTRLGFIHVDGIDHQDGDSINIYEAEVKGLFKMTESQGISISLESLDNELGGRIGYRYSF